MTIFLGDLVQVKFGHPEHLSGPLAVASSDNGCMNVNKTSLLKKGVNGIAHGISHPCHSAKSIGSRPQVSNGSQKFKGMPLLLKGVNSRVSPPHDIDLICLKLYPLTLARGGRQ